ncbi:hypothetical protein SAMN05421664_0637 [Chryseobacterium soldanellicola]|uniref:Lipoprotein n=1 Tax=Chryseobacterium soldanellicola TaxID=311333 RepID=A0A1H0YCA6_9FLAO|nr:hypothetical protein [Chryseobacterium soldanellicola]SDQ12808.1 hypothetical protein SAMN05421664_0637 [Chryseobacterium soldanellicola]
MTRITLIVFILFMFGCKKGPNKSEQVLAKIDTAKNEAKVSESNKIYTCEDILREIVLSSDVEAVKKFKDIFIRVENISEDKITIELYTKNNLSDSPGQKQIVENAVAWLEFLPSSNQLQDITLDPESPKIANYDKNILSKVNILQTCGIKPTTKKTVEKVASKTDCKEVKGEMVTGEECMIASGTLQSVYNEIVNKGLVQDSKFLSKELPKKTNSMNISENESGLMQVKYTINAKTINIEMDYPGGVTNIDLEQKSDGIKRKITYSAD